MSACRCAQFATFTLKAMNYALKRLSASRYQLRMQGACYSVNWMATLSASLSALRVNMLEARVESEDPHNWDAEFILDFRTSGLHAEALDYVSLTQRKPTMVITEAPQLRRFVLLQGADRSIRVIVEAEDHGGFQERFLARVAGLGLYPVAMTLRRTGPIVRNSFTLRGIGGRAPAEEASGAMETLLRRMQPRRVDLVTLTQPLPGPLQASALPSLAQPRS
jgi:hypothetical protein